MFLLIDTASRDVAVTVAFDGVVRPALVQDGARDHSSLLLTLIDRALEGQKSSLAGIGVVLGPGSYAGLRVGMTRFDGSNREIVTSESRDKLVPLGMDCQHGTGGQADQLFGDASQQQV